MSSVALTGALLVLVIIQPEPIRVSGDAVPRRTVFVEPVYPPEARHNWIEGIVVMEIVIDSTGKVGSVDVLRSIPLLYEAAIEAVRKWEYEPPTTDGLPVSVVTTVSLQFELPGGEEWLVRPDGEPKLRLDEYFLQVRADGSRSYFGTITNVAAAPIEGVLAVVSYLATGGTAPPSQETTVPPETVVPPNKLQHTEPVYPERARRAGIQGLVITEFLVDELGQVSNLRVLRSIPILDPAAIEAIQRWEYEPARREGIPVSSLSLAHFQFTPKGVAVTEVIAAEVGRLVASPVGPLERGESREFSLVLAPPEEGGYSSVQVRFLSDTGEGVVELPTSRQVKTVVF